MSLKRRLLRLLQTSIVSDIRKQKDIKKMTEEYLDWRLGIFGILLVLALFINISFFLLRSNLKKEISVCTPSKKTKSEPSLLKKDLETAQIARPSYISFSQISEHEL